MRGSRLVGWIAVAAFASSPLGCGEQTPMGEDLAAPAERDATPAPDPRNDPPDPPLPASPDNAVPRIGGAVAVGDAPERPIQAIDPRQRESVRDGAQEREAR
jgi:hypothetical protein